jgi:hypothetical protein
MANSHVRLLPDSPAARNNDVLGRYPGEDAKSDDYITIIKAWLQTCQSHTRCCQTISGRRSINARRAPLPTRCVEVLARGFRLRETGSETGSYIALSHRWTSETELCCTTTENIDARRERNADWLQTLPKTFLDALDFARRLGVKYVWVDSLCIIQHGDNGDDWRQESVKMADYYQQSLLTIVATSGSRDHGLIPPKISLPPTVARLPYRDKNGSRQGFFYVYSYNKGVDQQYRSSIQESELLTRGWVFQEWLLSRRIVYFTPSGMFIECQAERPHNERGEVSQTWPENDLPTADQSLAKNAFLFETASINSMWYRIVESYSALSLTKPEKDRIVALTGIAKEFREALTEAASGSGPATATVQCGLESVSGLWLRDLHRGLLWEQKPSECTPRRLPELPTWSWASTVCPVIWDDTHNTRIKPEVKVVAVITSEGDVFSMDSLRQSPGFMPPPPRVFDVDNQFACLCMAGKAQRVVVREVFNHEHDLEIASSMSGHGVESAKDLWRKVCSYLRPTEITGWASFEHPDYQEDSVFRTGLNIYAFHISTTSRVLGGYGLGYLTPWHDVFNVLLVRNIDGRKYERVGVGRLFGKEIEKGFRIATAQDIELI